RITSGIRLGSPAITARGMGIPEVIQIVEWMDTALINATHKKILKQVSASVSELCKVFPVYTK
ncbi:MAG: serine hydroxymethyltransferase, partial [Deltaproteobacteria bacterium]|nr:serine hydroxymethyltransferase [Deltaproteobacteria bacterium]